LNTEKVEKKILGWT